LDFSLSASHVHDIPSPTRRSSDLVQDHPFGAVLVGGVGVGYLFEPDRGVAGTLGAGGGGRIDRGDHPDHPGQARQRRLHLVEIEDRKSTRLNYSHVSITYAV